MKFLTTNLKRIPKEITNSLDALCEEYLLYIISHPEVLKFPPWNSQIQYLVTNTHKIHLSQALTTYDTLNTLGINSKEVLNIGTGGGYLEYVCTHFNNPIHTVEYENLKSVVDGVRAFRTMRDWFDVNLTYTMGSIQKEDFQINDCNKKYDWLILFRFFYHATEETNPIVDYKKVYDILSKLERYGKNCIIIGRKELESFKSFDSLKTEDNHQYGNILEIMSELKERLL